MSALNETEKQCVPLLNTVNLADHELSLDRRIQGTLEWVKSIPQFVEWVSSADSKLLWVTGHAGSGKTTLALHVAESIRSQMKERILVARFLFDDKVEYLRNGYNMLKCFIFQLVSQRKRLWQYVRKAYESGGPQTFEQFESLWSILQQLIGNEKDRTLVLIIDAIDECEPKNAVGYPTQITHAT